MMVTKRDGGDKGHPFLILFDNLLKDLGVSITRTPVTKTTDTLTGDETLTDGSTETFTGYIIRKIQNYKLEKLGLVEVGDGLLVTKAAQTLTKDDKIAYDGITYRIDNIVNREIGTTKVIKIANLYMIT